MVNDTTIKVKNDTYKRLVEMKGFSGCVSIDDVIKFLLDKK